MLSLPLLIHKRCYSCKRNKPLSGFDGLHKCCNLCVLLHARREYKAKTEYAARYRNSPEYRMKQVEYVAKYNSRPDSTPYEYHQYLVGGIAVGTPEKVLQGIKKYIDIGVTHFILHFIGLDETTLRLFDTKVIRNA